MGGGSRVVNSILLTTMHASPATVYSFLLRPFIAQVGADDFHCELGAAANFGVLVGLGGEDEGFEARGGGDQPEGAGGTVSGNRAGVFGQHVRQGIDGACCLHAS